MWAFVDMKYCQKMFVHIFKSVFRLQYKVPNIILFMLEKHKTLDNENMKFFKANHKWIFLLDHMDNMKK